MDDPRQQQQFHSTLTFLAESPSVALVTLAVAADTLAPAVAVGNFADVRGDVALNSLPALMAVTSATRVDSVAAAQRRANS